MRILIGCEESQTVTSAFRSLGHEAYSCDLYEPSGGHPEWHIHDDIRNHLSRDWEMIITFPPCTYLCKAQLWRCYRDHKRLEARDNAVSFVREIYNSTCPLVAIENPAGHLTKAFRHWDQIISPNQFGDPYKKDICLWLKGLPKLVPGILSPGHKKTGNHVNSRMSQDSKSKIKSSWKYFPGIASAMAKQWSNFVAGQKTGNG